MSYTEEAALANSIFCRYAHPFPRKWEVEYIQLREAYPAGKQERDVLSYPAYRELEKIDLLGLCENTVHSRW